MSANLIMVLVIAGLALIGATLETWLDTGAPPWRRDFWR